MTDFTGPLRVRRLDSDVTAAMIEAEGSAFFTGDIAVNASGKTIQVGSSAANLGGVTLVREAVCSAGSKNAITVPVGADLLSLRVVTTRTPGSAADHTIRFGTSADTTRLGSMTYTGALSKPLGDNDITVSAGAGDNWQDLTTSETPIVVDVTVAGSADANWTGIAYATYKV